MPYTSAAYSLYPVFLPFSSYAQICLLHSNHNRTSLIIVFLTLSLRLPHMFLRCIISKSFIFFSVSFFPSTTSPSVPNFPTEMYPASHFFSRSSSTLVITPKPYPVFLPSHFDPLFIRSDTSGPPAMTLISIILQTDSARHLSKLIYEMF